MGVSLGGANRTSRVLTRSRPNRPVAVIIVALLTAAALILPAGATATPAQSPPVPVIVRAVPGSGVAAEAAVLYLGGTLGERLDIIHGFEADMPRDRLGALAADPAVLSVTPDSQIRLLEWDDEWEGEEGDISFDRKSYDDDAYYDDDAENFELDVEEGDADGPDQIAPPGWLALVNDSVGAMDYWAAGYTGAGIDVALIDSGVAPVDGINLAGKVVNGLDISFESQADNLRYLDTYGHGTHMAGIIAGRDSTQDPLEAQAAGEFVGVAPGARILNVKVADANGAVDVSQVIAAIDWVVQHRNDHGLNVRVLNLSFGTDGVQGYTLDPLAYAVQVAWDHGIVVVVAAGNDGNRAALRNPAINPYIIAVGATDTGGTETADDDSVTGFSNCGTGQRGTDLVAPGRSIESLRVPGSAADLGYPAAKVGTRFFKGSGTSQAAAVVSGAAALIIDRHPGLSPDEVKQMLLESAEKLSGTSRLCQGDGTLDLGQALDEEVEDHSQNHARPTGTGSLEAARGSSHLIDGGILLEGEQDIFGNTFDSASWSSVAAQSASWSGGDWNSASWSGASWSSASWSGASWSSASWSSASWSGASWSSASWSSASWSGASWSSAGWSGASWSSASWSANVWSSKSWSGRSRTMSKSWSPAIR